MAPDRGRASSTSHPPLYSSLPTPTSSSQAQRGFLAERASEPQNFTLRSLLVGLVIGVVIAFSNTYFGLQTGWISGMTMPSALIGFGFFKSLPKAWLGYEFTPVENVLVQTVAGSVGTMPLGCGFVGVIPALDFLLKDEEGAGKIDLHFGKLVIWALGICFFGVVFAVPLRKQVIIREKLKFPSGTATALMIGVLHGNEKGNGALARLENRVSGLQTRQSEPVGDDEYAEEEHGLMPAAAPPGAHGVRDEPLQQTDSEMDGRKVDERGSSLDETSDWKAKVRLLIVSFGVSAVYTLASYFIPQLHDIPFLGLSLANSWLWTLNPSPAYVGQGIIMGPATTLHMLLGAIIGWGILSPMAKARDWAPGPVGDWTNGSKGWIVWISLAIMLADSIVSLGWLVLRPGMYYFRMYMPTIRESYRKGTWREGVRRLVKGTPKTRGYSPLHMDDDPSSSSLLPSSMADTGSPLVKKAVGDDEPEPDAPPDQLISMRTTLIGLVLSLGVCIGAVHYAFANLIPLGLTILALLLAFLLSIMGVRALGETDLNPVSGISKLTQLFFALATPRNNPNAVVINLLAGAISESAALQAGDLLQDLKTGHLLGAAPRAQFWGQLIGSAVGAVVSAAVYKLYTRVYTVPGGMFQVPTAYVWVFTARLVTGQGLPPHVAEWAAGATLIFGFLTALRVYGNSRNAFWVPFVPGGIAVAVGMYNTPSFTVARTIGGLICWYWRSWRKEPETPIIVLASGLILGEGLLSIANLGLASLGVPHL
ncbi:OPT superfamily [Elasticomyces elasticus]|nr:OPT superfamily [Elasticomyces elasticus]